MKKLILGIIIGNALLVTSCSTVKSTKTGLVGSSKLSMLKGDWQISAVDYDSKKFKVKPFDEGADAQCFVGSTWNFIPNNSRGSFTINGGGDCPTLTEYITFDYTTDNQFKFKKTGGVKAKTVTSGYALTMVNQTETNFTLQQDIPFDGENLTVSYQFEKISK